jgi:hypothetical protein
MDKSLKKPIPGGPSSAPFTYPVYQSPAKFVDHPDISEDEAY